MVADGEHLQAVLNAGRRIHAAVDVIDGLISARLGVHRNDLRSLKFLELGPTTPGELAAHTGLTSGSVTALIDRLEAAGFVKRHRGCADRRSVELLICATRLGELRALDAEIEGAIRCFFSGVPHEQLAETGKALGVFNAALDHLIAHFGPCPGTPAKA
ncbi:MarR family winged helix-turn-helix transcriptional regulator [Polymorphobacter fuscus]|uniref:MarR family transcriptional regulator n=1 Tax=Sandarakinorhabdus fusca TaxID=1439888 RepID=A0A7C9GW43_9SPHN|nr:MarR family transcriptional regulator [Polymorphobacter fuscus]KAB7645521.1 MarR family transcriptional regulator [Polymorphobacter fuscus]MQT17958.1 MarR family transcriptional regulator [Polymorphobacter fuscus]NJC08588.1 DNA-binding MarR family transcriptional regulator [Polymorphobacter fuscus]